jgi:hypothetical protein
MEKIGENNRKVVKIGQIISQVFIQGLEHDKIWAQWASKYHVGEHVTKGMMVQTL